ncbi:MIF4G domain-containing protein A-like isoform X2 [Myxocyprinus asiaticus]|uniref:MIF4G domain-containing protein A-like isoform X2 n=1 Tax=Myxocyprinus asiaticus TaxID=70543 RepID=UPI0022226BBD|nr:MIF4G domain-containing protein A-like isoform X2 [Myxocyprinus asiaticus]
MDSVSEYKFQALDMETQNMLKEALNDPKRVDLEKLSNTIVNQSLKDITFCKDAGRICYALVQAETQKAATSVFRRNLLTRLQQEFTAREETRNHSLQEWVCLVTFICNIFYYIKVNSAPIVALVDPVYDCLFRLAEPDSLMNEEEWWRMWALLWADTVQLGTASDVTLPLIRRLDGKPRVGRRKHEDGLPATSKSKWYLISIYPVAG